MGVVDINERRINAWNSKDLNYLPIFEPGLSEEKDVGGKFKFF